MASPCVRVVSSDRSRSHQLGSMVLKVILILILIPILVIWNPIEVMSSSQFHETAKSVSERMVHVHYHGCCFRDETSKKERKCYKLKEWQQQSFFY